MSFSLTAGINDDKRISDDDENPEKDMISEFQTTLTCSDGMTKQNEAAIQLEILDVDGNPHPDLYIKNEDKLFRGDDKYKIIVKNLPAINVYLYKIRARFYHPDIDEYTSNLVFAKHAGGEIFEFETNCEGNSITVGDFPEGFSETQAGTFVLPYIFGCQDLTIKIVDTSESTSESNYLS